MAVSGGGNIKVVVRVRPFNTRELDRNAKCIVQMQGAQTVLQPPPDAEERLRKGGKSGLDGQKTFKFDKSYWSFNKSDSHFAGQDNLFDDLGGPLLDNAFQGYNNCIFAYGQTGSGKSYSMMGYGEEEGVIPRICRDMFERITELQKDPTLKYTVEVSYLEIYNERVRDLLNPSTKGNLRVREHPSTGPYVEDLAKLVVRSFQEIESLMDEGNKARTVAATNMNETSSRSHAVFTLTLSQKRHDVETSIDTERVAKISLVDLAGSERATSTGATGARLKEGAEINRSLSTLGRVIAALADFSTGKKKTIVPYRDSVLTWLLKDSLGGNSMTAMIAAISPADINFEETLSTLRYADSAKRIKNHAVVNEDPNARMIRELKEELAQLRSKLGGTGATGINGEIYPPNTSLDQQVVSITQPDGTIKKVSKAEIIEQLSQSEKLYKDLNQTWEEKLQKTEQIHKEREAALEELGISIEKGFVGLSTPKKMPHLINLSDDPLLTECLIYNLKPGTTLVGNVDTSSNCEIRLNGSKILHQHCTFDNLDDIVTVVPSEGAAVMVNGIRVHKPKRLRSGNRIILGDFHIFRFNHPLEARAERAEQSLLRHSVTASQLTSSIPFISTQDRIASTTNSDFDSESSRPDSPSPSFSHRESDWSFARREAAGAILGTDQKIAHLTDDELDTLFEDVQRAREQRRRPESRLLENDEDLDSLSSFLVQDKYISNGTTDNFSLDTAITVPDPPLNDSLEGRRESTVKLNRSDPQNQIEQQKRWSRDKSKLVEDLLQNNDSQESQPRVDDALHMAKEQYEHQLTKQKEEFEKQIRDLTSAPSSPMQPPPPKIDPFGNFLPLSADEITIAKQMTNRWHQRNCIRLAESILQHAGLLKEAQVMSQIMNTDVSFQFAIMDAGQHTASAYDLVLLDISSDDDNVLDEAKMPCLGVRVIDFKQSVIQFWSLEKLEKRVQKMRQMRQYVDQQDYLQHFRLENPFSESYQAKFSFLGDASVPLTAVFESRVQDFTIDIMSPYTQDLVGIIRLSLEPSSAQAPQSMIKFNVIIHDMVGFAEREGTNVHAQMYVAGVADEGGVTTTQTVAGFDEGQIRFESVHSLSMPQSSPRTSLLKIAIYAQVTSTHLDKLISWDEIRESAQTQKPTGPRLPESEFHSEERHDVFTQVQISELAEDGRYQPVEVLQSSALDPGVYQLRQGLQRRITVSLTYNSTESLVWQDLNSVRVGNIHLVDWSGKVADLDSFTADIALKQIQEPMIKDNTDGTSNVTIIGQWDSSLHNSLLLDRTTADKCKIQISLKWDVLSSRFEDPMAFTLDQQLRILPRAYTRPQSILRIFSNHTRVTHSTDGIFCIAVRPVTAKKAADLWRMDTTKEYVNGEELLERWAPRRISLVRDFIAARKRRRRLEEIEAARGALSSRHFRVEKNVSSQPSASANLDPRQEDLLRKFVSLWPKAKQDISDAILEQNYLSTLESVAPPRSLPSTPPLVPTLPQESPSSYISLSKRPVGRPRYVATVSHVRKNPLSMKSGYLLMPSDNHDRLRTDMQWKRCFVDLRPPYLHIHSVPDGETVNAINLTHARIDHDPDFKRLLGARPEPIGSSSSSNTRPSSRQQQRQRHSSDNSNAKNSSPAAGAGKFANVFAVYGELNTFLFVARTETQKVDWILKIDQSYFSTDQLSSPTPPPPPPPS